MGPGLVENSNGLPNNANLIHLRELPPLSKVRQELSKVFEMVTKH